LDNQIRQDNNKEREENDEGDNWVNLYPNYGFHVMFDEL